MCVAECVSTRDFQESKLGWNHCMMQAANRRTNVVQIISKQMTVVHDQFEKGEGKYITHNTHST